MSIFPCAGCRAKEEQIKYLQTLVDRMLVKNGVAPVLAEKATPEPMEVPEVKETLGADEHIVSYGGDN